MSSQLASMHDNLHNLAAANGAAQDACRDDQSFIDTLEDAHADVAEMYDDTFQTSPILLQVGDCVL